MARQRPIRRQVEVLRAYIRAGSVAAAAHELGISETTVRQHLAGLYRRTGYVNAAQAAYALGKREGTRATSGRVDAGISGHARTSRSTITEASRGVAFAAQGVNTLTSSTRRWRVRHGGTPMIPTRQR